MNGQLLLVLLTVAAALAYLGRRSWRAWKGRAAGCDGCKCPGVETNAQGSQGPATLIPPEQLTIRLHSRR